MNKTIVCLKWGDKYSSQYVNVLYNMCKRHNTNLFNFVCFTDNPQGISPEIDIRILPNLPMYGWWFKPYVFNKEHNFQNDVLFLDLDLVIYDNIDKLWSHVPGEFLIIRDFTRHMNPGWQKFNSSVFRFNANQCHWIWEDFQRNRETITSKNHGDQDYLYSILKQKAITWPDEWIQSYKWEMRDRTEVQSINGKRNFVNIKDPKLITHCCIAVFHGEPNPHDVRDPWVIENWK